VIFSKSPERAVRLVVTRPAGDAERTAAALARQGHQVDIAPLMRIESVAGAALDNGPWSGLILTSANAVQAAAGLAGFAALAELRAFAVGARTATAARAAGFRDVILGGGDAQELTQHIRAWAKAERLRGARRDPLLYLAGEDVSHDLAGALAADREIVHTVTVYRAIKAERFSAAIDAALAGGTIDGVLHFSRRSAEAFMDCARAGALTDQALRVTHYCVSRQVAEPLVAAGAKDVRIAERPEEAALVTLVGAAH
jgi:uroporphyrinogen-III synthase